MCGVQEATEAIKPVLGEYYLYDDRFLPKVRWCDIRFCLELRGRREEFTHMRLAWVCFYTDFDVMLRHVKDYLSPF